MPLATVSALSLRRLIAISVWTLIGVALLGALAIVGGLMFQKQTINTMAEYDRRSMEALELRASIHRLSREKANLVVNADQGANAGLKVYFEQCLDDVRTNLTDIEGFLYVNQDAGAKRRQLVSETKQFLAGAEQVLALAMAYIRPSAVWGGAGETGDLQRRSTAKSTTRIIVAALLVGLLLATQFALMRLQDRFEADPLADARVPFARNTMEAARAYMPFGSGMGTFVSVYPGFEKAGDGTTGFYANRAHNDVLELWLEAGVAGLSAMVAFAASEHSAYTSGSVVVIDAGLSARAQAF